MSGRRWYEGGSDPLERAASLDERWTLAADPRKISVPLARQAVRAVETEQESGDPLSALIEAEENESL